MAAPASSVAAKSAMPRSIAVRTRQSVVTSATPTRSMSGMARTASATRLPITPYPLMATFTFIFQLSFVSFLSLVSRVASWSGRALAAHRLAGVVVGQLAVVVDEEAPGADELVLLSWHHRHGQLLTGEVRAGQLILLGQLGLVGLRLVRRRCRDQPGQGRRVGRLLLAGAWGVVVDRHGVSSSFSCGPGGRWRRRLP